MTLGGNNFNDFPENVPTRKVATKIEKTFLVFFSAAVGLFLECSITSTPLRKRQRDPSARFCTTHGHDTHTRTHARTHTHTHTDTEADHAATVANRPQ